MSKTTCISCGNIISDKQIFCSRCGLPAIRKCPICGAGFTGIAEKCSSCGLDIDAMVTVTLVRMAAEHNQTAITRLYEKTYKRYYMICKEQMYSSKKGDIDDALQDAYVKIFSSLDKLENPLSFEAWGAAIVRNTCIDILRKNSPLIFDDEEILDAVDFDPTREKTSIKDDPSEYFDRKEVSVLVNQMLLSTPEEQRICIMMYYSQDMSVKSIASELNVSENTVKSRLKYGRANIEKQVLKMEKEQGIRLHNLLPFPFFIAALGAYSTETEAALIISEATKAAVLQLVGAKALTAGASAAAGAAGGAAAGATAAGAAGGTAAGATGGTAAGAAGGTAAGAAGGTAAGAAGGAAAGQPAGGSALANTVKGAISFIKGKMSAASAGKAAALARKAVTGSIVFKGVEVPSIAVLVGTAVLTGAVGTLVAGGGDKELAKTYADEIEDMESRYGTPSLLEDSYGRFQFMNGLSGTDVFDYDGDGKNDLLVIYPNGTTAGMLSSPYVPGGDGYNAVVLNGKKKTLFESNTVGDLQHIYAMDGGRAGIANLLVMDNLNGKRVIQMRYNHTEEGLLSFRNYYMEKGKTQSAVFSCESGAWRKDGNEISADEWISEVTPDRIIYCPLLTNSWMEHGQISGTESYETTPDLPLLINIEQISDLKTMLQEGRSKRSVKNEDYIRLYSAKAMECYLMNYGQIKGSDPDSDGIRYYSKLFGEASMHDLGINGSGYAMMYRVVDIDKNGVPEMMVEIRTDLTFVFTVRNGKLICCGRIPNGIYSLHSGEKPGVVFSTYFNGPLHKVTLEGDAIKLEDISSMEEYPVNVPIFDPGLLFQIAYPVK